MSEADNQARWDGHRGGRYEVWYLTLNHLASRTGLWIRYTVEAPLPSHGEPYARLWFAAFDAERPGRGFALNRRFPIDLLRLEAAPFGLHLGQAVLRHDRASGAVEGAGHSARWDLRWLPSARSHRHLPAWAYRSPFTDTGVLSPNPEVAMQGTVELDGRTLVLEGEPGGQSHLWGRKHAHAWAWGRCTAFEGRSGVFLETLTVRLRRAGLVLPALTMLTVGLDGRAHRLVGLRGSWRRRGRFGTARYTFAARGRQVQLDGAFSCRPEDMVLAEYTDPDGEPAFCANTEVGALELSVRRAASAGAEWLRARSTAQFEVGGRDPDPAISRRHLAV